MFCCTSCSSNSGTMDLTRVPSEEEFPCNEKADMDAEKLAEPKSYRRLRNSFFQDNEDRTMETIPNKANKTTPTKGKGQQGRTSGLETETKVRQASKGVLESGCEDETAASAPAKKKSKAKDRCKVKLIGNKDPEEELENSTAAAVARDHCSWDQGHDEEDNGDNVEKELLEVRYVPTGWRGKPEPRAEATVVRRPPMAKQSTGYSIDFNVYSTKKNISQGLVDIALLTANMTQLKYLLSVQAPERPSSSFLSLLKELSAGQRATPSSNGPSNPLSYYFYWANLYSICVSVILQIIVGILLLMNSRHDVKNAADGKRAECCNNWILTGIFFITLVNVFIGVFISYDD